MTDLDLGKHRAEEFGLIMGAPKFEGYSFYCADDIHKLLGAGVEMSGIYNDHKVGEREMHFESYKWAKHKALLIGIRPIAQESREEKMEVLLSELLAAQQFANLNVTYIPEDWAKRAKALLGDKEK